MNTLRYHGAAVGGRGPAARTRPARITALGVAALAVALLTLAAAGASAAAQRAGTLLTVRFTNNSDRDLTLGPNSYNGCPAALPERVNAGATATWTLDACGDPRGNVGTVSFNIYREPSRTQISWDAPVVGDSSYTQTAPGGYVISRSGGQGFNPTVDFTFDCNSTTCDGIPDSWKRNGIYINPADGSAHTAPAPGINLHVDAGPNSVMNDVGGFTGTGRAPIFHYAISAHNLQAGTPSSGIAPTPGSDLIVSLGSFANQVGTVAEQAGTFLHELGHNLNLEHGGDQNVNNKPQYYSVMNYPPRTARSTGTATA
ncbi:hypothetical protein [Streptomyces sp. NPDC048410]|uniref:hypothetical protein n=1 Tax=Streptomyces sp. NPDC048410 TaxID=3365545 RepID=UPI00371FD610